MDLQIERILADSRLSRQIFDQLRTDHDGRESLESALPPAARLRSMISSSPGLEKIVRRIGRPVLTIRNGTYEADTIERWRQPLETARALLERAIPSVGRVELQNDPDYKWAGTAWVVGDGLVVTNRHVAEIFARRDGSRLVFRRKGGGHLVSASIDFVREHESNDAFEIAVDDTVYLSPDTDGAPDVAVLRLAPHAQRPEPIHLAATDPAEGQQVAVIGYPAYDYDEEHDLQEDIFSHYEVKRLAPGEVMAPSDVITVTHDCSTLGGNSGSVVLDLDTGEAVALHYSGRSGKANYAVRASVVRAILDAAAQPITLSPAAHEEAPKPRVHSAEDLADRTGYDPQFLGIDVPVPQLTGDAEGDLASVDDGTLLHYTHFSVAMSRSRRLARFTAVNIDGRDLRRIVRKGDTWFVDGRLPAQGQVCDDVYAKNKLDRGHLVRRLDPVWGHDAARADDDTFHFTNACPQHEGLNQKTWLSLEDYILENAGAHELRVSVFTGPVFRNTDRDYRDIQIPEEFWKVVVMLREPEQELLVTAYLLTQRHLLSDIEFVFGPFRTYQVPVAEIERLTSLDFGQLRQHDPLAVSEEGVSRRAGKVIESAEDLVLRPPSPEAMKPEELGRVLTQLRKQCKFAELVATADRNGVFDSDQPVLRKLGAQGLIELKQFDRAIQELQKLRAFVAERLAAPKVEESTDVFFRELQDEFEKAEAEGLLGRIYKQLMIDERDAPRETRVGNAGKSLTYYFDAYAAAKIQNLWHGINYVAVAHYARRRLELEPPCGTPEAVARELLHTLAKLEERGLLTDWDRATRAEAVLALDDVERARREYAEYLQRAGDNQFMRNSPLRQLRELWELPPEHPVMQLFSGDGAPPGPAGPQLQARQGGPDYQSPDVNRDAELHARSVIRIGQDAWAGEGTGFVFDGAAISPNLAGRWLALTCAHVCPKIPPDRVVIMFFGADGDHMILQRAKVLWTSPTDELDATLLALRGGPSDAKPAPLATAAVQPGDDAHIIGHPLGGAKWYSAGKVTNVDLKRFYYGTLTNPGSSGSPVFNNNWELTGLHRAGDEHANQGGRLDEIVRVLRMRSW